MIFKWINSFQFMKKTIDQIYLLVHPFYGLDTDDRRHNCKYFSEKYLESMNSAASEGSYGVLMLMPSNTYSPSKELSKLVGSFKEAFPWKMRTITHDLRPSSFAFWKLNIFYDLSREAKVSARGFWTEQCLKKGIHGLLSQLHLPSDSALIAFDESCSGSCASIRNKVVETQFIKENGLYNLVPSKTLSLEEQKKFTKIILREQY